MHELTQNGPDLGGVVIPTAKADAAKMAVRTADQNPSRLGLFRKESCVAALDI